MTINATTAKAAELLLERRQARRDLVQWSRLCGYEPAQHHRLILEKLARIERGEAKKIIIMTPPGSAKSTYVSYLFPPHYLANNPGHTLLSCSYSYTLIEGWGRKCRNLVDSHGNVLGYTLRPDSRAAGEWETSNGGRYFCAGVNAGIAGHRAHLGIIDDFVGNDQDAYSKLYNDQVWDWYWSDFWPRLFPTAAQIIICNHRHHEDLVARLLEKEGKEWEVLTLPYFAEDDDVLGRQPGERLWPEFYTEEHAATVRVHPELNGLYQQHPTPDTGDFFRREWIEGCLYKPEQLPKRLTIYVGSDHAVSIKQTADLTCLLPGGIDVDDTLWILPDLFWKRCGSDEAVEAMIELMRRRQPFQWWAERGHISKSIGPFLNKRMQEEGCYTAVEEVTPSKDKPTRAQSIRARMCAGKVRWPSFAHWLQPAIDEMMTFPVGKHDDFVDALSHLGMGLDKMVRSTKERIPVRYEMPTMNDITLRWLKDSSKRKRLSEELRMLDY